MDNVDLATIVRELRDYPPIRRKFVLPDVIDRVRSQGFHSPEVVKSLGEDAALLDITGSDTLCVVTTDAIDSRFSNAAPWGAGYSGILVSVEDIYACGGTPKAASISIAYREDKDRDDILAGLNEASRKFEVPIVRGHTHEYAENNDVQVSIIGVVKRGCFISAGGGSPDEKIGLIFNPEGQPAKVNPMYWDTTTFEESRVVVERFQVIPRLGRAGLITACKDISNGGIIGTLLQMVEYSRIGAIVELEAFDIPSKILPGGKEPPILRWLKMYLTTAYVVCYETVNEAQIEKFCTQAGLSFNRIGKTTREKKIILVKGDDQSELFDFESTNLTFSHLEDSRDKS